MPAVRRGLQPAAGSGLLENASAGSLR